MSALVHAKSYRDLIVYQKSRMLAQEIFRLTCKFPKEEMFSLTDQVRRSSRSIGAQIAEAWAKRRYEKHFVSKLTDAVANNRKHNTGSRLHLIANIFPLLKLILYWKDTPKLVVCLAV